jgi:hypothetical protein
LRSLVARIRELRQARRDGWREMAASLCEIKDDNLWLGQGHADFDAWCWHTLRLNRRQVSALLGVATAPIGGAGRRRGRKPGAAGAGDTAADGDPPRTGAPMRARGQIGEVEVIPETAITSTCAERVSSGIATGRDFVAWAARQLERLEQHGLADRLTGLPPAERAPAARVFAGLRDYFRRCEEETRR